MIARLLHIDDTVSSRLRLNPAHRGWWQASVFLAHSGDSWFWLAGLIILWALGSPLWRERAIIYAGAIVFQAVFVLWVKFSVRRSRPPGEWGAIYRSTDPHSFPSGHAARAFLLAVLALGLGPAWLAILLWIWAPLVSLSRVATGVHYLSDVLAGMLFGLVVGVVVLELLPIGMALIQRFFPFII